jgi:hypothetical protein
MLQLQEGRPFCSLTCQLSVVMSALPPGNQRPQLPTRDGIDQARRPHHAYDYGRLVNYDLTASYTTEQGALCHPVKPTDLC